MAPRARTYSEEFKAEAIKLLHESGRAIKSIAQEIGVKKSTLHSWLDRTSRKSANLLGNENNDVWSELKKLRKEKLDLRRENNFLKKSNGLLCQGEKMKFAFIEEGKASH